MIAVLLSILDILSAIRRSIVFLKSSDKSFKNFWRIVVKNEEEHVFVSEYVGLVEGAEDIDSSKLSYDSVELQSVHLSAENHNARWPKHARRHSSEPTVFGTGSPKNYSDDTLHEVKGHRSWLERCGIFGRIGHAVIAIIERALVIGGFGQLLIGIVTYTGRHYLQVVVLKGRGLNGRSTQMIDRWMSREIPKWLFGTPHQLRNIWLGFHLVI